VWALFLYEVSLAYLYRISQSVWIVIGLIVDLVLIGSCAITRFAKTPKCYACGTATGGMFNKAEKILAKMEKRNQDLRDKKKRAKEDRGDSDSEQEGEGEDAGIEFGGGENSEEE
jgi:hypothetical protein